MRKTILTLLAVAFATSFAISQTVDDGIKFLYYLRVKSAAQALEKVVASNPKDARSIYWLGQAYLKVYSLADNKDYLEKTKDLYQKALNDGVNDAWIWVGMGHVQTLENNDINSAKQKFEQAITATKGKKGVENWEILNAIGRAMADGGSQQGDPQYGVDKLTRAAQINTTNPDIDINLGVCYLKQGSEKGGPAVEAFTDATRRDPKYAEAYYRIGRVYESQNNAEFMNEWFGKAITADPSYGPVYLEYFNYYKERDVNAAKEYLDKYVANSDQDCATDYFTADYMFRAGKYQESLAKVQQMENTACKDYVRINILYAYDYDKLGDSVKAKDYLQKFFQVSPPEKRIPSDYMFAAKLLMKFAGNEDSAMAYLDSAVTADTVKANKMEYMKVGAALMANAKRPDISYNILLQMANMKGAPLTGTEYYYLTKAALDSKNCAAADSVSKSYVAAFPDQQQAYGFNVSAAKMCDVDTTKGLAVEPINNYNNFLMKDTAKNKKTIFSNDYYLLIYYAQYAKDLQKALSVIDQMMVLYPDPASDENKFLVTTQKQLQAAQQKKSGNQKSGTDKK